MIAVSSTGPAWLAALVGTPPGSEVRTALSRRPDCAPVPRWWSEPADLAHRQIVDWADRRIGRATLPGASSKLAMWRASTVAGYRGQMTGRV